MFSDNTIFLDWLQDHAEAVLVKQIQSLNEQQIADLRTVYNNHSDLAGKKDLGQFMTLLGRAIPHFMEAVNDYAFLPTRAEKKAFIIELTVAHFRLLDRGLSGEETNFLRDHRDQLSEAFPNGPEVDVVRPMAQQGLDQSYDHFEDMQRYKKQP